MLKTLVSVVVLVLIFFAVIVVVVAYVCVGYYYDYNDYCYYYYYHHHHHQSILHPTAAPSLHPLTCELQTSAAGAARNICSKAALCPCYECCCEFTYIMIVVIITVATCMRAK